MKIQSMIAVYFVVWWMSLFLVLPFGVRNAAEEGEAVEEGHEPGAPLRTMLWRKAAINTVLAAVITAAVIFAVNSGVLGG
jgi:predicted secreted protein